MNKKILFTLFLTIGFILYGLVSVTADTVEDPSDNNITLTDTCTPACTPTYTPTYTPTSSSDINNNLSAKSEVIVGSGTSTSECKPRADCTQNDLIEMSNGGMSFDEMSEFLEICYQKSKNASDIIAEVKKQGKRLNIQELKIALEKYPDQESEVQKWNRERYEKRRAERLASKTPTPSVTTTETISPSPSPSPSPTPTPDTTSTPLLTDNTGLPSKSPFNDVTTTDWYYEAVSFISSKSIANGTPDGNFHPNNNLTRGECIVMLMKAYNLSPDTNPSDNFLDAGDTYYTNYLSSAKKLGITNGVGNNKFDPNKAISRQEVVVFIYNALKVLDKLPKETNTNSLSNYKDSNDISIWASTAMDHFTKCGVIAGVGDKLHPKLITTRAQMAQILFNIL